MSMEGGESDGFEKFLVTGIYEIPNANAVFVDPVRMLNSSYNNFLVSPTLYYARSLPCARNDLPEFESQGKEDDQNKKRRQRKRKRNSYVLNEKEQLAEKRHWEARSFLSSAYEAFVKVHKVSNILQCIKENECSLGADDTLQDNSANNEISFVEIGKLWQAPLYEISLCSHLRKNLAQDEGEAILKQDNKTTLPLFNSLVENKSKDDMVAECLCSCYILPRESSLLMSDMNQIRQLIPGAKGKIKSCPYDGFNLILIDPPWENKSVHRRAIYSTLPNRYFLSIPVMQLAHQEGALVALWITNREKLRAFVEKELFPAWGISYVASFYWLKVTEDGYLLGELDLAHHKPYECILLGYIHGQGNGLEDKVIHKVPPDKHVVISVPGDHSRKPPVGRLLLDYTPGPRPVRPVELFARELLAGWTSWGNEPLRFQESRYFLNKMLQE